MTMNMPQKNGTASEPKAPSRMSLKNKVVGKMLDVPMRVLLYGVESVGKSTFAASAPAPIFLSTEDGTSQLDIERFPDPKTWEDIIEAVQALMTEDHDRKTLVVDTIDWLEPFVWEHVCRRDDKRDIESYGYGKGYTAALAEWRGFVARLDTLRAAKRMHIILLAHAMIRPFKNPDIDVGDFDRYELKLNQKASGMLKEWSDCVLFAQYETFAAKKDSAGQRTRGMSTGARIMHTERRAAWDAKNRYALPEQLPLSWDDFSAAVQAAAPVDAAKLQAEIAALLPALEQQDSAAAANARKFFTMHASDPRKLAEGADRLRARIQLSNSNAPSKEET